MEEKIKPLWFQQPWGPLSAAQRGSGHGSKRQSPVKSGLRTKETVATHTGDLI